MSTKGNGDWIAPVVKSFGLILVIVALVEGMAFVGITVMGIE